MQPSQINFFVKSSGSPWWCRLEPLRVHRGRLMMNMLESRRCLSSLGFGTPKSLWAHRTIVIPGRLCQSAALSWCLAPGVLCCPSSAPCTAPPPLARDHSSPGTAFLVPKALPVQAHRAVQSLAASWPQVYQLCYQDKGMCKPLPTKCFFIP